MDKHNQLRDILIKFNNPEFGDVIIDEICRVFGAPDTNATDEARLFWVVDSHEDNEEIFATKAEAVKYAKKYGKQAPYRIFVAEVRHFFQEKDGSWNYDDQADTFDRIITVIMQTDTRPVKF